MREKWGRKFFSPVWCLIQKLDHNSGLHVKIRDKSLKTSQKALVVCKCGHSPSNEQKIKNEMIKLTNQKEFSFQKKFEYNPSTLLYKCFIITHLPSTSRVINSYSQPLKITHLTNANYLRYPQFSVSII